MLTTVVWCAEVIFKWLVSRICVLVVVDAGSVAENGNVCKSIYASHTLVFAISRNDVVFVCFLAAICSTIAPMRGVLYDVYASSASQW